MKLLNLVLFLAPTAALLAACAAAPVQPPAVPATNAASTAITSPCAANPLVNRDLYLRGDFSAWKALAAHRLRWRCNAFEGVMTIHGEQAFKVGDDDWSADADFGAATTPAVSGATAPIELGRHGANLVHRFNGLHHFTMTLSATHTPMLTIAQCPAPPLADTPLYLLGTMNAGVASPRWQFRHVCDAYYLDVDLSGEHRFHIADASASPSVVFGGLQPGPAALVGDQPLPLSECRPLTATTPTATVPADLSHRFQGPHTLRLAWAGGRPVLCIVEQDRSDGSAAPLTDPIAQSLRHDSRDALDKSPFGAVAAGTEVAFSLTALPGVSAATLVVARRRLEGNQDLLNYTEVARIALNRSPDGPGLERWLGRYRFTDIAVHGYWFDVTVNGRHYALQNNREPIFWTREAGSNGVGVVEASPASPRAIRRFRITAFDPAFVVPDWAADAVYYYIFPERFRNGDKSNDPQPGLAKYHDATVELHPHWSGRPYKPGSGDGSDAVYNNDFFGGDIAGIIDKLDDIADLGANTLYITPLFSAASNHKYDTADYHHIDPHFGSDDDFSRLCTEAAKRGIRVIPDTSLNHVGSDSVYFDRFGNHRGEGAGAGAFAGGKINPESPFADWFRFDRSQADPDHQYKGWVGVTDLPELNKDSASFRRFAYGAADSVMKRWLDRGAAGWRMDVAPWIPDDFWREWRREIKNHRPDALTIAETWFDSSKYLLGDSFDSAMNYIFRNTVLAFAAGGNAAKLYRNLELIREAYPPPAFHALMNLLSSHDQARSLHVLGWPDDASHDAGTADAATVALAKQRFRLALFFQMTYPGAPAIYYGDEVGMTGGDDPYNRGPYPWADKGGHPDLLLRADVKRLTALRHDHPVLRRGELLAPLLVDDSAIVLARRLAASAGSGAAEAWALTASHNGLNPRTITFQLPTPALGRDFVDALTGAAAVVDQGRITLTLPALSGAVLISR
jgi:glycosidase